MAGVLDTSFGTSGVATTDLGDGFYGANGLAMDSSGNVLVATSDTSVSNAGDFMVVRFTSAGVFDTTFGFYGVARTDFWGGADRPSDLVVLPDSSILVGGSTVQPTDAGGAYEFAFARYTSAGVLDSTFGSGGRYSGELGNDFLGMALTAQGEIVVDGLGALTPDDGGPAEYYMDLARFVCP
jgi:uncharacterized delta-60 repeat protein